MGRTRKIVFVLWLLLVALVFLWLRPGTRSYAAVGTAGLGCYLVTLLTLAHLSQWLVYRGQMRAARITGELAGWLIPQSRRQRQANRMSVLQEEPERAEQLWLQLEPHLGELGSNYALTLACNYATALIAAGRYRRAVEVLMRPEFLSAASGELFAAALRYNNLACAHICLGEFEAARQALDEGWKIAPAGVIANYLDLNSAALCHGLNDSEGARRHLAAITPGRQGPPPAVVAYFWARSGFLSEARAVLPAGEPRRTTERVCFHLTRAWLDPARAAQHLQKAAATNSPGGQIAWHALQLLGREAAEPYLQRALANDPDSYWTRLTCQSSETTMKLG